MIRSTLALLLLCAAGLGLASPAQAARMSYLDNGVVKVGVDLDRGGLIVYLAPSGAGPSANLVDATTLNEGIQPWFEAGDGAFGTPAPPYETDGWNPSVGGDAYGNASYLYTWSSSNDGTTIHTDTHPEQWALNDTSCTCEIEQWITLEGAAVHLRVTLRISGSSSFQPALRDEQLPAMHLASKLDRLFAYTGADPYTGGALTELAAGSPTDVTASESWAALVDASGAGVGVFHPHVTRYEYGDGFLAPVATANLYPGSAWESDYSDLSTIVLGSVAQIRAYAAAHRPDARPDYQFTGGDSLLWTRWNVLPADSAAGSFSSAMVEEDDPQLLGPDEWFQAASVPTLYVSGAWHTHDTLAQLYWRAPGRGFDDLSSVHFRVVNDGLTHTYAVPLAGQPLYAGTVAQLRLDPVCCAEGGTLVDIASISWRPDPNAIPVAIEHTRQITLRLVRDRRHRLGALGMLVATDNYQPCVVHARVRLEQRLAGTWVPAKTVVTGAGGAFQARLPASSRSRYRAVADVLTLPGNVCSAISATAK